MKIKFSDILVTPIAFFYWLFQFKSTKRITALLLIFSLIWGFAYFERRNEPTEAKKESILAFKDTLSITITTYNPEPEQTDDSPFLTASFDYIHENLYKNTHVRWCALSYDLFVWHFNMNDTIRINCPEDEYYSGLYIVKDCMARYKTKWVDGKEVKIPILRTVDLLILDKDKNNKLKGEIVK